jgi:hypothetical protein
MDTINVDVVNQTIEVTANFSQINAAATDNYRSGSQFVTASTGQIVTFSTPLASDDYTIILPNALELGAVWTSKTSDGFTIDSDTVGTLYYMAIINV